MIVSTCPSCYEAFILVHKVDDWWFEQFCLDKHVELVKRWDAEVFKHVDGCFAESKADLNSLVRSYANE